MDYIKSRWSSTSDNSPANQSQAVETSYNTVTFTNDRSNNQNPIIISTRHPSSISIIHEVRNPSLKIPEISSPTESYHSVVSSRSVGSNFYNENMDGKVNMAYTGSGGNMSNQQQENQPEMQNRVYYQRSWNWHWPWEAWNTREKIFLLVIVLLSLCLLSLTSILSVVIQKNIQYRDLLFAKLGIEV